MITRAGFLFCLLAFGCKSSTEEVMGKDKMVECLLAIHLSEARLQSSNLPIDKAQNYFLPKEKEFLAQYNGDSLFIRSYRYYLLHPNELEEIYDSIIDSLSLREVRLQNPTQKN